MLQFKEGLNTLDKSKMMWWFSTPGKSISIPICTFLLLPLHCLWHWSGPFVEPVQVTGGFLLTLQSIQGVLESEQGKG